MWHAVHTGGGSHRDGDGLAVCLQRFEARLVVDHHVDPAAQEVLVTLRPALIGNLGHRHIGLLLQEFHQHMK